MRRTARRNGQQSGFSLVELMLAIVVLAIAMGAVAATLGSSLRHSQQSASRSVAANLAAEEMDAVRQKARGNFTTLPLGNTQTIQNVDGVDYKVSRDTGWVSAGATADSCSVGGTSLAYLRISVSVSWPGIGGVSPAKAETVITPPVGAYDPSKGHVAVRIRDRDAEGQLGVRVFLKKGGVNVKPPQDTTAEGCAFFDYVNPDDYTVEIAKTGYVNGQGVALPSSNVTAVPGAVASIGFDFDAKSQLRLTRSDATSQGSAIPTNAPIVISNPQLQPNKKRVYPAIDAAPMLTIDDLFPYAAGFEAWVGDCADADPESEVLINPSNPDEGTMRRYASADRDAAIPVVAGSATLKTVRMASLRIDVRVDVHGPDDPLPGAVVRATHAPDELCSAGATLTYSTVTDVNGQLKLALPLGTWTIEVDGRTPESGSWPTVNIAPPYSLIRSPLRVEVTP